MKIFADQKLFVYILQNGSLNEFYNCCKTYCNIHLLSPGYTLIGA